MTRREPGASGATPESGQRLDAWTPARLLDLYPALAVLDTAALETLLQPQGLMRVPAGVQMFAEQQPCRGFPLLLEGAIKVVKSTSSGREMLLYRVEPGQSCIITSSCLLGHTPYTARGVAETALTLLMLPAPQFNALVALHAPFRDFVFQLFSERLADLMELVEEVAFQRLDQRLAKLLLARFASEGETLITTHQSLAEELGSVREIVSRLLKGFASEGVVHLGREQISLVDIAGLQRLAAPR